MKDYQSPLNSNTINDIPETHRKRGPVERLVLRPEPHEEIKQLCDLKDGRYYHCIDKLDDRHSIHKVYGSGKHRYLGLNRMWATKENPQAFERWAI